LSAVFAEDTPQMQVELMEFVRPALMESQTLGNILHQDAKAFF